MDLIDRAIFIGDTKKVAENMEAAKMEIVDQPTKQKLEKKD